MNHEDDELEATLMERTRNASRLFRRQPTVYDTENFPIRSPVGSDESANADDASHEPFGFEEEEHGILIEDDEHTKDEGVSHDAQTTPQQPTSTDACQEAFSASSWRQVPLEKTQVSLALGAQALLLLAAEQRVLHVAGRPAAHVLAATEPKRKPSGLAMTDIVSSTSHLWLMRQTAGGPVRVRMFDSTKGFTDFLTTAQVSLPAQTSALSSTFRPSKSKMHSPSRSRGYDVRSQSSSKSSRTKSSVSSNSESDLNRRVTETQWLDLQTTETGKIRELLRLLCMSDNIVEMVLDQAPTDHVEHYPSLGYVFVNIACLGIPENTSVALVEAQRRLARRQNSIVSRSSRATTDAGGVHRVDEVVVSCIVFPDWIITIHRKPFEELADLVKQIQIDFTLKRTLRRRKCHVASKEELCDMGSVVFKRMMYPSWVLSTLVDFVVSNFLPDPTPLLRMVDNVEAKVMLISSTSDEHQQALGAQIARLRRLVTRHRRIISSKEQLLTQLLLPVMRTIHISKRSSDADVYVYCQSLISKVAERIDAARDMLQATNGNFAATSQLKMAKSGRALEYRMQFMSIVAATFGLPSLIAALFGMNVKVPYQTLLDGGPKSAFAVIVGCIGLWLLLMVRSVAALYRKTRAAEDTATWDPAGAGVRY